MLGAHVPHDTDSMSVVTAEGIDLKQHVRVGMAWAFLVAVCALSACSSDNKATDEGEMPGTVECGPAEACGGCECPAETRCYSSSEPCREACPKAGEKAGEYYCTAGLKFPCDEAIAEHEECTICGCSEGLYCNAGQCQDHKPDGAACGAASECEDTCCRTLQSLDEEVCESRGWCRMGIGEDCKTNADCPDESICTDNGFCTGGCDEDADCGVGSRVKNICVSGDFNAFRHYFPDMPGVCVPICDRDDPALDCSHWGGACEINYGAQSWCRPDLP